MAQCTVIFWFTSLASWRKGQFLFKVPDWMQVDRVFLQSCVSLVQCLQDISYVMISMQRLSVKFHHFLKLFCQIIGELLLVKLDNCYIKTICKTCYIEQSQLHHGDIKIWCPFVQKKYKLKPRSKAKLMSPVVLKAVLFRIWKGPKGIMSCSWLFSQIFKKQVFF